MNGLRTGFLARRILIGLLPVGLIFFTACGGGGKDNGAAQAEIAALRAQLAQQCVAGGQADSQVTRSSTTNPDGTQSCDFEAVPQPPAPGSGATTAAVSPSCQTYAQFKSMQCKFDQLANMPDCGAAAQNLNSALMAQTLQQLQSQQNYGNNGNSNNNNNNSSQILLLQSQLAGSGAGNQCTAQLQKAFQDWQTFQNGAFANSQQGCQYLQNNLQLQITQIGQALQAQGNTVSIQQYNQLNNTLTAFTANSSNGPCQVANMLQAMLPQYLAIISGASNTNALGGSTVTGSFNLPALTGGATASASGSSVGSLGGTTTTSGSGSSIGTLHLTGTGTGGTSSSYASQATTSATGSSVGSALSALGSAASGAAGTATTAGASRAVNNNFYQGTGTGSSGASTASSSSVDMTTLLAKRGAVIPAAGSANPGASAGTFASKAVSAFNDNSFFDVASGGSTDGIDAESEDGTAHAKTVSRRGAARAASGNAPAASGVRHVLQDVTPEGTFNAVY